MLINVNLQRSFIIFSIVHGNSIFSSCLGKYCKLNFTLEEIRAGNEEEIAYLCLILLHCMYISKRVPSLMKTALSLPDDVQEILYCLLNGLLKESSTINRDDLQNALDRFGERKHFETWMYDNVYNSLPIIQLLEISSSLSFIPLLYLTALDNGSQNYQSQTSSFYTPVHGNEEVFSTTPRMKPFHQFFQVSALVYLLYNFETLFNHLI